MECMDIEQQLNDTRKGIGRWQHSTGITIQLVSLLLQYVRNLVRYKMNDGMHVHRRPIE